MWSTIQRFGVMTVNLISNVVLARILSPDDFGCVAMLMIFISLANTLIDGGFGSALIQKKEPTQTDYSTIFYWNLLLSVILYIILFAGAPLVARYYRIELLTSVLRVQGIVLLFNALGVIQHNQLRKQLQFKKLAISYILSALLSLIIAIATALSGWGVWSLVAQQLSLSALTSLFLNISTQWKPQRTFSVQSFKGLFKFGGFILLSNLFSSLSNEIHGLLVGRMFTPKLLGLFNQAYRLEGVAATSVSSILDQVTYPVLASLQDDKLRLQTALKKFFKIPAFVCCPLMIFLIVAAKPIITCLYTEKWIECVPYFQILCLGGLGVCLQGPANNAITAVGKSDVFFRWTIIKRTLTIVLSIIGIYLGGMYGLLCGNVAGVWVVFLINGWLVSRHIGYPLLQQILDVLPYTALAIVVGGIAFLISLSSLNMYLVAILQFITVLFLYLASSALFKFEGFTSLVSFIREYRNK